MKSFQNPNIFFLLLKRYSIGNFQINLLLVWTFLDLYNLRGRLGARYTLLH